MAALADIAFLALVKREVLATLRSHRSHAILAATVASGILVVYLAMPARMTPVSAGPASIRLFLSFIWFLFAVAAVLLPPVAAVSLVAERHRKTYEFLHLTGMRPLSIVSAKILDAFGFYLLLLTATLPIAGILFFMVGVDWRQFIQAIAICTLTAFNAAAIGVACSARFSTWAGAAVVSFFGILVLIGLPQILFISLATGGLAAPILLALYAVVSPAAALVHAAWHANWIVFACAVAYQFVFAALTVNSARRVAARPRQEGGTSPALYVVTKPRPARFRLFPDLRRLPGVPRPLVFFWEVYAISAVFGVLLYLPALLMPTEPAALLGWVRGIAVVISFAAAGMTCIRFPREYERGSMDGLRMCLLRPRALVLGQMGAVAALFAPILIGIAAGMLCVLAFGEFEATAVLACHLSLYVCVFCSACLGLLMSLLSRRSAVSLLLTFGACLALFFGVQGTVALTSERLYPLVPVLWTLLYDCASPLSAIRAPGVVGPSGDEPWFWTWLAYTVLYMLLALALLGLSVRVFRRRHSRDR